jgi:hypothetical protein
MEKNLKHLAWPRYMAPFRRCARLERKMSFNALTTSEFHFCRNAATIEPNNASRLTIVTIRRRTMSKIPIGIAAAALWFTLS